MCPSTFISVSIVRSLSPGGILPVLFYFIYFTLLSRRRRPQRGQVSRSFPPTFSLSVEQQQHVLSLTTLVPFSPSLLLLTTRLGLRQWSSDRLSTCGERGGSAPGIFGAPDGAAGDHITDVRVLLSQGDISRLIRAKDRKAPSLQRARLL